MTIRKATFRIDVPYEADNIGHQVREVEANIQDQVRGGLLTALGHEIEVERWSVCVELGGAPDVEPRGPHASLPEWTADNCAKAESEGWGLFNYPEAPEIMKDDEFDLWADDWAVIMELTRRAHECGDSHARKALLLHWAANAYMKRNDLEEVSA